VKTADKLKLLIPELPVDLLDQLKLFSNVELINEAILCNIMFGIVKDDDVFEFCDVMEQLCDEVTSKKYVNAVRKGKLTHA